MWSDNVYSIEQSDCILFAIYTSFDNNIHLVD